MIIVAMELNYTCIKLFDLSTLRTKEEIIRIYLSVESLMKLYLWSLMEIYIGGPVSRKDCLRNSYKWINKFYYSTCVVSYSSLLLY